MDQPALNCFSLVQDLFEYLPDHLAQLGTCFAFSFHKVYINIHAKWDRMNIQGIIQCMLSRYDVFFWSKDTVTEGKSNTYRYCSEEMSDLTLSTLLKNVTEEFIYLFGVYITFNTV